MEFNEQFVSESELLIHSKLIIQAILIWSFTLDF